MADFSTLRALIAAKAAETMNVESGSVFEYEPELDDVEADPFVTVTPSANENEYASTSENRREYAFMVRVFVARGTPSRGNADAETLLTQIVDDMIDLFDQDYTLSGNALLSLAAPSRWGYAMGTKEYRTAEITITAKTDFDVFA